MQEIIEKLHIIETEFIKKIMIEDSIYLLNDLNFKNGHIPNYENELCQKLYLLRYLYGYSFEYIMIFNELLKLTGDDLLYPSRILSIGCGAAIDYWSFRQVYDKIKHKKSIIPNDNFLDYIGVDIVKWDTIFNMQKDDKIYISKNDISSWIINNNTGYRSRNIIIFPKSIGEFTEECFNKLLNTIESQKTIPHTVAIIGSFRTSNDNHVSDTRRFNEFVNRFKNYNDYIVRNENTNYPQNRYGKKRITEYSLFLEYPISICENVNSLYKYCNKYKSKGNHCEPKYCENHLESRSPILYDSYIDYKIVILERG